VPAAYAVFGGVIFAAYDEFGNQSLLDLKPLVTADPAPLKRLPPERMQGLPARTGGDRSSAAALTRGEDLARPGREPPWAVAFLPEAARASEAAARALTERPAMAPPEAEGGPASRAVGAALPAATPLQSASPEGGAATLEAAPPELVAAAPLGPATLALSDEVAPLRPGAARPPAPALKPLDTVPTATAQAMLPPQVSSAPPRARLADSALLPSLKPIVMPAEQRPDRAREQGARRMAAARPSLPDAFRAFWTNLKILLAAGPAPRVIRAGGDDGDHGDRRPGTLRDIGRASGDEAGGSRNASGGSSGGSAGDRDGGGASSGGGGPSSGGAVSSGGGGSSTGGGDSGKGKGGGKGGDKGGGGKGGDKGGRGGDDDDDDD
jgi:hypothetical protein